jgi:hypothetical protein
MENPNNIFDQVKARKVNVPDTDYFSQLADSIIEQKDSKAKVIPMYKKPLVWITSAAAVIAVLIVFNYEGTSDPSINLKLALSEISTDEIVAYMDEHVDDFDTDLIAEAVPVENIYTNSDVEEATMPDAIISFETISDNEIMEYLLEEGIDLDELSKI